LKEDKPTLSEETNVATDSHAV